jgi:hypothetical protein
MDFDRLARRWPLQEIDRPILVKPVRRPLKELLGFHLRTDDRRFFQYLGEPSCTPARC